MFLTNLPFYDVPIMNEFFGIKSCGFAFTISNKGSSFGFSEEVIFIFVKSYANKPENLLYVLGNLILWDTFISTPFFV